MLRSISNQHYVNVWSQTRFDIKVTQALGTEIVSEGIPVLTHICEADNYAPLVGFKAWQDYSAKQKIFTLLMGSSELISTAGGYNMVLAQYLHEMRAFGTAGFQLEYYPVKQWDNPVVFSPNLLNSLSNTVFPINNEFQVEEDGTVTFPDIGLFSRWGRPLDKDNVLKMSYMAGLDHIPTLLIQEALRVATYVKVPANIGVLKAGSSSITYRDREKLQAGILANLRGLF